MNKMRKTILPSGHKDLKHYQQTASVVFGWSHFERLIRIENKQVRAYYLKEATEIEREKLFIKQRQG